MPAGVVLVLSAVAIAATGSADPFEATSNRSARTEAVQAIPWREIDAAERKRAHWVVRNASLYRRLPTRVIDCDPDLFAFLVQHPEVVVDVWRVMGISRASLDRLPGGAFRGSDGAGTTGTVRYLYANWNDPEQQIAVVLAAGAYEGGPFVHPVRCQTVLLMRSGTVQEANGRHYITVRVDSFIHLEQLGIELVAKTLQPLITRSADQNFIETLTFVSNFSRTAEKNPQGMQRLAGRLTGIDDPIRAELVQLCFRTAERHAQRDPVSRSGRAVLARHDELSAQPIR